MIPDSEIGRVIAVDAAEVSIKLNHNLKGMTRNTYEGTQEIGSISSYVIIPVGAWRLIAMVTHVELREETEVKTDPTTLALPVARRSMKAILIGTIGNNHSQDYFQQGISIFPVLDNPVYLPGRADLDAIFGPIQHEKLSKDSKYHIPIGESSIMQGRPVRIDPDAFFGKHAAILGSTGSGKSCTIAALLQAIHAQEIKGKKKVKRTTCIILDTNGEYSAAFPEKGNDDWKGKSLHISTDLTKKNERLIIPYWFLNSEEFVRLFHASKESQFPVLLRALRQERKKEDKTARSSDTPSYFDKLKFSDQIREIAGKAKIIQHMYTMLFRIERLLEDRRFEFLFGPVGENLPNPKHALATFLRDVLGIGASRHVKLSTKGELDEGRLPFYDRQRERRKAVDIVILDLSFLSAEVLENVTALIGRLILEFLQRLDEHGDKDARGSLPVVLVLEEAQNYIKQSHSTEEESASRLTFERIAREGRKYGLSLVIASQRPSELSKTVLSQCSSFIVHRLQNPEDLHYFRGIVPSIYKPMLEQIPAFAPQIALVLGECVSAPALVKIRDAQPLPKSQNPKFYDYWVSPRPPNIKVETICKSWK